MAEFTKEASKLAHILFDDNAAYRYPELVSEYLKDPDRFVAVARIKINGKFRKIVQYRKNADGKRLRSYHETLARYLGEIFTSDPHSFAYKKGLSTLKCVSKHLGNNVILKTDIHAFFDSVTCEAFYSLFQKLPRRPKKTCLGYEDAVRACFYENSLPIGFVSSPIISDIYLNGFDRAVAASSSACTYTRYADDIIVSAKGENAEELLLSVKKKIEQELTERQLCVNTKKTYIRYLNIPGDAIHLLGLNLVRRENEQYDITVSDAFLRKASIDFCDYLREKNQMDAEERDAAFSSVFGKISYVTANSARSSRKLRKMLSVKLGKDIPSLTREALIDL